MKKSWKRLFLLCLLAALLISSMANAVTEPTNYDSIKERLNKLVKRLMLQNSIPGVSIMVIDHGNTWVQDYGFKNLKEKTNFTSDTVVKVGEIARLFTATAKPFEILKSWQDRSGEYAVYDQNYPLGFHIKIKNYKDYLIFNITNGVRHSLWELVLKPINEDEAILQGYEAFGQETVRAAKDWDDKDIIIFSGLVFKRIK